MSLRYYRLAICAGMKDDKVYRNTRKFVLSDNNPFFFKGKAGEGIGGPMRYGQYLAHQHYDAGLTSADDDEIKCVWHVTACPCGYRVHARMFQ